MNRAANQTLQNRAVSTELAYMQLPSCHIHACFCSGASAASAPAPAVPSASPIGHTARSPHSKPHSLPRTQAHTRNVPRPRPLDHQKHAASLPLIAMAEAVKLTASGEAAAEQRPQALAEQCGDLCGEGGGGSRVGGWWGAAVAAWQAWDAGAWLNWVEWRRGGAGSGEDAGAGGVTCVSLRALADGCGSGGSDVGVALGASRAGVCEGELVCAAGLCGGLAWVGCVLPGVLGGNPLCEPWKVGKACQDTTLHQPTSLARW